MVMLMNPNRSRTSTPATEESVLFRLEQATLRVGAQRLLAGTTWKLCAGQNWVILGANGSGKTTLAGTLTGETPVVAGRRWVEHNRLNPSKVRTVSFESHQRLIARDESQDEARCFAQQALRGLSVSTILAQARVARGADHTVLETWMRQAGLWDLRDRPVRHLSSGEMRQVMIARALLDTPRLLIIDEPFDGLDPFARRGLAAMLSRLMAGGLQIVLITHHLDEVLPEITHYLMLRAGRVVEQGPWRPWDRVQMPMRQAAGPGATGSAGSNTRADDVLPQTAGVQAGGISSSAKGCS